MFAWYAEEGRSLYRLAQKLHQDGCDAAAGRAAGACRPCAAS